MNVNIGIPVTIQKNRGTVRHGDFYSGCMAVIKGSAFVNSRTVEINPGFLIEILQTDIVQKESTVSAVITDCNYKEVPI
jgi:hypothetical protein